MTSAAPLILFAKAYVAPYTRGGHLVGGYNTGAHRAADARQGSLFDAMPPQTKPVSTRTPADHLRSYFDRAEGDQSPKRAHAVLDGSNGVKHWTTGNRAHAEDWVGRNMWADDHPNHAVVKVDHAAWKRHKGDIPTMMSAAREEEARRQAAIPVQPAMDWNRAAPNPTHLVLHDWKGKGTTIGHRDASGSLHGGRDVAAGPDHDRVVDAWVKHALDSGLSIQDHRKTEG